MSRRSPSREAVDEYVSRVDPARREVVEVLRRLVLEQAPNASETIKWGQPCYSKNGNLCYIAADVDHVKLGFFRGGDLPDPGGLLEGTGKKMRHVKVRSLDDIPEEGLSSLIREAVSLDERQG